MADYFCEHFDFSLAQEKEETEDDQVMKKITRFQFDKCEYGGDRSDGQYFKIYQLKSTMLKDQNWWTTHDQVFDLTPTQKDGGETSL